MVDQELKSLNDGYEERFGFHDEEKPVFKTQKGINEDVVREISKQKNEPSWMLDMRLKALGIFNAKKMPEWGGNLKTINFDNIKMH